jgi:hypothetical protein
VRSSPRDRQQQVAVRRALAADSAALVARTGGRTAAGVDAVNVTPAPDHEGHAQTEGQAVGS